MKKEFFLFRMIKKIFFSGLANILPILIVISILVIAYSFLNKNLVYPINALIKKQLETNLKDVAVKYMKIDPDLYKPLQVESYEDLVKRIQNSSASFYQAKMKLEEARKLFEKDATPLLQKKESSNDEEYKKFLEKKIEIIRETSGFNQSKKEYEEENIRLRREIERENEIRLTKQKWGDNRVEKLREEIAEKYPDSLGFLFVLSAIFMIGMLINTVAGRTIHRYWEKTIISIPLVKKIYPYSKQLTQFLFSEKRPQNFKSVVMVEYPRKGIYAVGFPTGDIIKDSNDTETKYISLFVPSSPTPFTGYTIIVDEKNVIPLDISVEEAIRFCVTGGVIKPRIMDKYPSSPEE